VRLSEFDLIAGQGESDAQGACKITIRPERVNLDPQSTTRENRIPARVERVVYVGSVLQTIIHLGSGQTIQAWLPNDEEADVPSSGAPITVHFPREALRVLPDAGAPVVAGEL
jgi:ABC-type Fe3+/spermidine/putrescine transport system ATPase subunit